MTASLFAAILILLVGISIYYFVFRLPKQKIKKIDEVITPSTRGEWSVRILMAEIFANRNKYLNKNHVIKINSKLKRLNEALEGLNEAAGKDKATIQNWEAECKEEIIPFDFLGINRSKRNSWVKTKSMAESVLIDIDVKITTMKINFVKISLFYGSIAHLRPEYRKDKDFIQKIDNAINEDLSWLEENKGKKLGMEDDLGFEALKSFIEKSKMPEFKKYSTRIKELSNA